MKTITDLIHQIPTGSVVLIRVDYNIAITGSIDTADQLRITASIPTVRRLLDAGYTVLLLTHMARSDDSVEVLLPILRTQFGGVRYLDDFFVTPNAYSHTWFSDQKDKLFLLPNVRSVPAELINDIAFAKSIARVADAYVNEAFSVCHRVHSSVVGLPSLLPAFAGIQLLDEISHLNRVRNPVTPALMIIGGVKFETKLPLIMRYLDLGIPVAVVGALAHPIYRARGYAIGESVCDTAISVEGIAHHPLLWVSPEVIVSPEPGISRITAINTIYPNERIVDMSEGGVLQLIRMIQDSNTVVWNGPLGWYEGGYSTGTLQLAHSLIHAHSYRVLGGGDTVAVIGNMAEKQKIADFFSTGGGAMLDFLIQGTLPGIEALRTHI